jgi:hypothetical protein
MSFVITYPLDMSRLPPRTLSNTGPLRAAFPAKVHDSYFPKRFLDIPVEPPSERAVPEKPR